MTSTIRNTSAYVPRLERDRRDAKIGYAGSRLEIPTNGLSEDARCGFMACLERSQSVHGKQRYVKPEEKRPQAGTDRAAPVEAARTGSSSSCGANGLSRYPFTTSRSRRPCRPSSRT